MYDLPSQEDIDEVIVDAVLLKVNPNLFWFIQKVTINLSQTRLQRLNILNN
jgi:hypothetical protein